MADVSFAYVPAEGFTAFGAELRAGTWGNIDVSEYVGADGRTAKALCDAPTTVVMKLQMNAVIAAMLGSLKSAGSAKTCDEHWDETERRLGVMISAAMLSKDPLQRTAAERLHKWLLLGDGAGQTNLKYQQEVDFGRKQIELSSQSVCAADIALLGLGEFMADIATATTALAEAIGHGMTGHAPSRRKSAATVACRNAFSTVAKQLDWVIENGLPGPDKEQAITLRAPLIELAARYPAKPVTTKVHAEQAPPLA